MSTVPGKKTYLVWSNQTASPFVTMFLEALRFQKEKWEWVTQADDARWWLIDDAKLNQGEALRLVQKHVQLGRPAVALPKSQGNRVNLPTDWRRFDMPLRPADVFCWTHDEKKRLTGSAAKAAPEAPTKPAAALHDVPWRTRPFKLVRWSPSTARGDVAAVRLGVGRLLGNFTHYEQALALSGLDAATLEAVLAEAQAKGNLEIEPAQVFAAAPVAAGMAEVLQAQPWRAGKFKLIQWPSLKNYKGNVAITTGIGRLMGMFITYDYAEKAAGIDAVTLNAILAEAYANGKMKLEPAASTAG